MHPLLYRNDVGEVTILWRRLVLWIAVLVFAAPAANFALGYFVGVRFRATSIALSTVAIAFFWALMLYFFRRHAQRRSLRQVSVRAVLGGVSFVCVLFALATWDRQSVLRTRNNRERLQAEIMAIVGDGRVRVSGNPGATLISVKRLSFNDDDLKAVLQLTDQLNQADAPITNLDLSGTIITDDGVSSLASLDSLKYCFLDRTPLSDTSIAVFEQLPKLKLVSVRATRVTSEGLLELSQERPEMNIEPKSYIRSTSN